MGKKKQKQEDVIPVEVVNPGINISEPIEVKSVISETPEVIVDKYAHLRSGAKWRLEAKDKPKRKRIRIRNNQDLKKEMLELYDENERKGSTTGQLQVLKELYRVSEEERKRGEEDKDIKIHIAVEVGYKPVSREDVQRAIQRVKESQ